MKGCVTTKRGRYYAVIYEGRFAAAPTVDAWIVGFAGESVRAVVDR